MRLMYNQKGHWYNNCNAFNSANVNLSSLILSTKVKLVKLHYLIANNIMSSFNTHHVWANITFDMHGLIGIQTKVYWWIYSGIGHSLFVRPVSICISRVDVYCCVDGEQSYTILCQAHVEVAWVERRSYKRRILAMFYEHSMLI